jgi:hypothetical protein
MGDGTESDLKLIGALVDRLPAIIRHSLLVSEIGFNDLQKLRRDSQDEAAFANRVIAMLAQRQGSGRSASLRDPQD